MRVGTAVAAACVLGFLAGPVVADEPPVVTLVLKGHQFVPTDLEIPAGVKVKLLVRNDDPTTSEFESTELHREKVVLSGEQITVFVGPLDPGRYEFFDDFHPETRGHLVVK
jgi:hypothetical protein